MKEAKEIIRTVVEIRGNVGNANWMEENLLDRLTTIYKLAHESEGNTRRLMNALGECATCIREEINQAACNDHPIINRHARVAEKALRLLEER